MRSGPSLLLGALFASGCSLINRPVIVPDPARAIAVVRVEPTRPWTDTGVSVRKGERLFFSATGTVQWEAKETASGPDGINGVVGWSVGAGGLVGRVGDARPFAIGSRTTLFPDRHPRPPHRPHPPPPITMPGDGTLFLGFREFVAGNNTGAFDVTIRGEWK
jgi:hypothetical protein